MGMEENINLASEIKHEEAEPKKRGLLPDSEYQKWDKYNFDLFTVADYLEYRDLLISMPYNWELMKFFHEEYLNECKRDYRARKYGEATISFDEISNYLSDDGNPLHCIIERIDSEELWNRIIACVSLESLCRIIAHRIDGKPQNAIARSEGIHRHTISRSIARGEEIILEIASKLLKEKKLNGFVLVKDLERSKPDK